MSATETSSSFVAGTLVHTKEGLCPIEQIKVGDWVLSQPEGKGELTYKPVTRTFVHEDADYICLLKFNYTAEKDGMQQPAGPDLIAVTYNHPFFAKDKGWVEAAHLYSDKVEMANGNYAYARSIGKIFQTHTPNVGWAPVDERGRDKWGYRVEFAADGIKVEHLDRAPDYFEDRPRLTRTVYNFEVQDNHTYYVGKSGLWAHNKGATTILAPSARTTGAPQ